MRLVAHLRVPALAVAVGVVVWALTGLGGGAAPREGEHAQCFKGLRLLRHAIGAFQRQHGFLPGTVRLSDGMTSLLPEPGRSSLVRGQLTDPRDPSGFPSWNGALRGLLVDLPLNPFTGSREIVVVPDGVGADSFAATSMAGWAYLANWGHDATGPLPPGTVLPCGTTPGAVDAARGGVETVQEIAFEIEDFQRWR